MLGCERVSQSAVRIVQLRSTYRTKPHFYFSGGTLSTTRRHVRFFKVDRLPFATILAFIDQFHRSPRSLSTACHGKAAIRVRHRRRPWRDVLPARTGIP